MARDRGKGKGVKKRRRSSSILAITIVSLVALVVTAMFLLRKGLPANVVLITLDTTRWDYVSPYRKGAPGTPNLEKLAARGTLFKEAVTVVPLTLPAHTSLLTGLYPSHHGVRNNGTYVLGEGIPMLPEILLRKGYETAAFVGSFVVDSRFGLARGFVRYDDDLSVGPRGSGANDQFNLTAERSASSVTERTVEWLVGNERAPFFLWVHYYDPHDPYSPPSSFRESFTENPYAGEIAYVDYEIGRLLPHLFHEDGRERTVIVVVADHGESLGEHEETTHGLFLYEPAVRIPLIMILPGITKPGSAVEGTVRIIDIMPTLLEYLGIEAPPGLDGTSLIPLIEGNSKENRECLSETLYPLENFGWSPLFSLRSGNYKYIQAPRPELYDIAGDPEEKVNLVSEQVAVAGDMAATIKEYLASRAESRDSHPSRVDPETAAKLASLGYVWSAPGAGGKEQRDPKDMVEVRRVLVEAQSLMDAGRYGESIEKFRQVLRQDPENPSPLNQIGLIFYRMEIPDSALAYLKVASTKDPMSAGTHHNLAALYEKIGDLDMALEEYEKTLRFNPSSVEDLVALGNLRLQRGDPKGALEDFRRAVALDQKNADGYAGMADAAVREGRYQEAIDKLTEGIGKTPPSALLHNKLGTIYQRLGRSTEALSVYERALSIDPNHLDAVFNRGTIRTEKGLHEEAMADFTRLLEYPEYRAKALFSLAVIHEKKGEREQAIEMYTEFLSVWHGDPAVKEDALRRIESLGGS
jgi:arylsulfatase A-like enzyme/Tfp pilus assembly protein PilF